MQLCDQEHANTQNTIEGLYNTVTNPIQSVEEAFAAFATAVLHPIDTAKSAYNYGVMFTQDPNTLKAELALTLFGNLAYGGAFTTGIGNTVPKGLGLARTGVLKWAEHAHQVTKDAEILQASFWKVKERTTRSDIVSKSHSNKVVANPTHPLEGMTPHEIIVKVNEIGLNTKKDNAILWSGLGHGDEGIRLSKQYAAKHGGTTLEMTAGGAWLDSMDLFGNSPFNRTQAAKIWGEVSKLFTQQASGQVRTLIGQVRPNSIYQTQELSELRMNPKVTGIDELYLRPKFETVLR